MMIRMFSGFPKKILAPVILTACISAFPCVIRAERVEVTPFVGLRFGGYFTDISSPNDAELDDSSSFGLIVGFILNPNARLELTWSRQETDLQLDGFFTSQSLFDLKVDYYHIGSVYQWDRGKAWPFLGISAGLTRLEPEDPGLDTENNFSVSLGGGIKYFFREQIGIRLEGRGYTTFLGSSGGLACGSFGCFSYGDTDILWQFEARAGVTLAF